MSIINTSYQLLHDKRNRILIFRCVNLYIWLTLSLCTDDHIRPEEQ